MKRLGMKARKERQRSRSRRLRLENLEARHLLSGIGLQVPIVPLTTGGPGPAVESQAISGDQDTSVQSTAAASQKYTAPSDTQAWRDGSTVHYQVFDPTTSTWKSGSTTYTSNQVIVDLVHEDGVVAWTVARKYEGNGTIPHLVGFAVYDTDAGAWVTGESDNLGVLSVESLSTKDGVVAWTVGYPTGTGGYKAREVGGAVYDQALGAWQKFQTIGSQGLKSIETLVNENGMLAWTIGTPDGSGGYDESAVAAATYDYTAQAWQRYQVNAQAGTTVSGLDASKDAVVWKINYGSSAGDVGALLYDTALQKWRAFASHTGASTRVYDVSVAEGTIAWTFGASGASSRTGVGVAIYDVVRGGWQSDSVSYADGRTVGELTNGDGVVAWSLVRSTGSGTQADVAFTTFDTASRRWVFGTAENPSMMDVAELTNVDGIVAWIYREPSTGIQRSVGAAVFDPGRGEWKHFLEGSTSISKVADLQNAGGLVGWKVTYTGSAGDVARDVVVVAYDYGLGRWQRNFTNYDASAQITHMVVADGIAAWATVNDIHLLTYDRLQDAWKSYDSTNSPLVRVYELEAESGLAAWTLAYVDTSVSADPKPRDVGYAIYDPAAQAWNQTVDTYLADDIIEWLVIRDVSVQYSRGGTTYVRAFDATNQVWFTDEAVPQSVFVVEPTAVTAKRAIRFSDMSLGATDWQWDFGDGYQSQYRSTTHAFADVGVYQVVQTVTGPGGSDTSTTKIAVVPSDTPTDLGTVSSTILASQSPTDGVLWYQLSPNADGAFTVAVSGAGVSPDTAISFVTVDSQGLYSLLGSGTTSVGVSGVTAGTTYYVAISGLTDDVNVQLDNPATLPLAASQQTLFGTNGDDVIDVSYSGGFIVTINGETVHLDAAIVDLEILGFDGNDTITLHGGNDAETAIVRDGHVSVAAGPVSFVGDSFETIVYDAAGGADVVHLYDTAGDDVFTAKQGAGSLVGGGLSVSVQNVEYLHGYATAGGTDVAHLFDSAAKDVLTATADWTRLTGGGYLARAKGFEYVHGYSTAGGNDSAVMTGTASDDTFVATPEWARLTMPGAMVRAKGFESVTASGKSGNDTAWLYGSSGDDVYTVGPDTASMTGSGYRNTAVAFETVVGVAGSGNDIAHLYDTTGDDVFTASTRQASLVGGGFDFQARNFDYVHAYGTNGGTDVAHLYDTAGNDTFEATSVYGRLRGTGYVARAKFFEYVHAYSTAGEDVARLYDTAGNDLFSGNPLFSILSGSGYYNRAKGFAKVYAYASGGNDKADMKDSAGDDILEAGSNWVRLRDNQAAVDFLFAVYNFDKVDAKSSTGNDTSSLDPSSSAFLTATGW
ncbi:hypothetical protein JCM19992_33400 [Thermostilla marina]